MSESDLENFVRILRDFDTAMLVTERGSELRSRPMVVAEITDDGRLWFVTSVDSPKLDELTDTPQVNVSLQREGTWLSVSGTIRTLRDRDRIEALWNRRLDQWYPQGHDDPTLRLLEVVPTWMEYWDRSGADAVSSALELARSAVGGDGHGHDERHAKVDLPKSP